MTTSGSAKDQEYVRDRNAIPGAGNQARKQGTASGCFMEKLLTTFPFLMHKMFHDFVPDSLGLELNRTQIKALMVIHTEAEPHMTHMCHVMNLEKGSLTSVVDGLIELGLVERRRNPDDRRIVNVILTDSGKTLVDRHIRQAHAHVLSKLSHLTAEERSVFEETVDVLHRIAMKL